MPKRILDNTHACHTVKSIVRDTEMYPVVIRFDMLDKEIGFLGFIIHAHVDIALFNTVHYLA